jgi:hypothetical protein
VVPPDDSGAAALADALARLYAVLPEDFVATRTRLVQEARGDGDAALAKEVGRLRRPTVSAWVVNQVVRRHPDVVTTLHEVGRRLRAAQGQLDAGALHDLRPDRDRLLDDWAAAASDVASEAARPLAPATLDEVRGTVIAALAGDEASAAVASGHLTRALSYSGFGEVDLSEAVVRTSSGAVLGVVAGAGAQEPATSADAPKAKAAPRAAKKKEADDEAGAAREAADRERVEAAQEAHAAAAEAAQEARLALDQARDRADETRWRVEELEDQLKQARAEHRAAEEAATEAARARRSAEVDLARTDKALRDARGRRS